MRDLASGPYTQAKMMADVSMERTLHFQAAAIWPQERRVFEGMGLHRCEKVVDLGCGTGEISSRLAANYEIREIVGVDLLEKSIELARQRHGRFSNLSFQVGDAAQTPFESGTFDLSLNRHLLQAIPNPKSVILEMKRITKPGGVLYFLAEDYAMIHCTNHDGELFWIKAQEGIQSQGTDLLFGRKLPIILQEMGFSSFTCDFLTVATWNTPRETLAEIFRYWMEGYAEFLAEHNHLPVTRTRRHFQDHIDCCLDPKEHLVWHIPIMTVINP